MLFQLLLYVNINYSQKHMIKITKNWGIGSLMGTVMAGYTEVNSHNAVNLTEATISPSLAEFGVETACAFPK